MLSTQLTRRAALGGAALIAALPAWAAVPDSVVLLAPGPEEGAAARLALRASAGLSRGLIQAAALRVAVLGGPDGITAANRFASAAAPDGRSLLLLPGAAAQAHLVGESRARFEPRQWTPVAAVMRPVLVAGRGDLPGLARAPLRLALPSPDAPETAALLALDLLGRAATPVFGLPGAGAEAAVAQGAADAMVIAGPRAAARAQALGLSPWFSTGLLREEGPPDLPRLSALAADAPTALLEACAAGAAAAATPSVIVLPALTPADTVAPWREAARRWVEAEPLAEDGRLLAGAEAAAACGLLCPRPEAVTAYRNWLAGRLGWRAS